MIKQQLVAGNYRTDDDLFRDTLQIFAEIKTRQVQLIADVQAGLAEADAGLAGPLDASALIDRWGAKLRSEGIPE